MAPPPGLHVVDHPARAYPGPGARPAPTVVLVHGTLDRGASFLRVVRRLPELHLVTYDRRGYQGSRTGSPPGLAGHVQDLVDLATSLDSGTGIAAVGHSLGGAVVMGAAATAPHLFCAIGAYEPPLRWFGFGRPGAATYDRADPAGAAELFFRRMMGRTAWDRLSPSARAERLADGPALVTELADLAGPPLFAVADLKVPAVFGRGGPRSEPHHRDGVTWLVEHAGSAEEYVIDEAGHGAHLSHPDAFAAFVRRVVQLGTAEHPGDGS